MNSLTFSLLSDRGSLTEHFKSIMGETPLLTCLSQGHQAISGYERKVLDVAQRRYALVREIKMGKGEHDWMWARTVVPEETLQGSAKRIAHLNDTPIGKILFGRHGARRGLLQINQISNLPTGLIRANLLKGHDLTKMPLWQRESIFEFNSGPLLITEIFLPDCPIYENY